MGIGTTGLAANGGSQSGGGSFSRTTTDPLYMPQWPNVVAPSGVVFPTSFAAGVAPGALGPRGVRVIVPKTGTLHDFSWMPTTSNGNTAAAIYDTGDASAGNRTLLYSSGSVATGTVNTWQTVDPALAVTAGQQLDFWLMTDGTAAFMKWASNGPNSSCQLPANFNPVAGGASPKLIFSQATVGSLTAWPNPLAEASVLTSAVAASFVLIARVS